MFLIQLLHLDKCHSLKRPYHETKTSDCLWIMRILTSEKSEYSGSDISDFIKSEIPRLRGLCTLEIRPSPSKVNSAFEKVPQIPLYHFSDLSACLTYHRSPNPGYTHSILSFISPPSRSPHDTWVQDLTEGLITKFAIQFGFKRCHFTVDIQKLGD